MEQKIVVTIITPYEILLERKVSFVTISGEEGEFSVLPFHEALISVLRPGIVTAVTGAMKAAFFINGGIARVKNNKIELLTDFGINIENTVKQDVIEKVIHLENELTVIGDSELEIVITKDLRKYRSLLAYLQ
ncbi:MAG: ATP synthase F1 subunit epsilon [Janthinobacterium lividum]